MRAKAVTTRRCCVFCMDCDYAKATRRRATAIAVSHGSLFGRGQGVAWHHMSQEPAGWWGLRTPKRRGASDRQCYWSSEAQPHTTWPDP